MDETLEVILFFFLTVDGLYVARWDSGRHRSDALGGNIEERGSAAASPAPVARLVS